MQTKCLRLMGKKLLVALTLEGKFAAEGLHDLEDDDDMLAALARELVEKDGVGETADAVWSQLKEVYDQLPTACQELTIDAEVEITHDDAAAVTVAEGVSLEKAQEAEFIVTPMPAATTPNTPTLFGLTVPSLRRKGRRTRVSVPEQPSLFSLN